MRSNTESFPPERFGEALSGRPQSSSLQIVLRKPPPGTDFEAPPDPFARMEDLGGACTVLLGQLAGGVQIGRHVAIMVQKDWCGPTWSDTARAQTAQFQENWFRLAHEAWTRLTERGETGVARRIPSTIGVDERGSLLASLPLFFCKRRRLFFHTPCPSCGEPLTDCRDEQLLTSRGLPTYTIFASRYVYCPRCAEGDGEQAKRFFACVVNDREAGLVGASDDTASSFLAPSVGIPFGKAAAE